MTQISFDNIQPVFIMGIARSGTTLVQSLLDGHPQLLVDVADSRFGFWYTAFYRWYGFDSRIDSDKQLKYAINYWLPHIFNEKSQYYQDFLSFIPISEFFNRFESLVQASKKTPKDFLLSYYQALGEAAGALGPQTNYWVDKSLSCEFLFHQYQSWFPSAKYIFVTRDPRDVFSTYRNRDIKNHRKITSVGYLTYVWDRSISTYFKARKELSPDQYCLVRYEDLITDPHTTIAGIVNLLKISDHDMLRTPTKGMGRVSWGGNPETGKKEHRIYQSASGKWKKSLTLEHVNMVESILGASMQEVGYSLTTKRKVYPYQVMALWLRKLKHDVLKLGL